MTPRLLRPRFHVLSRCFVCSVIAASGARAADEAPMPLAPDSGYAPRAVGPALAVTDADRAGHDLMLRVLEATRTRESQFNLYYGTAGLEAAQQQSTAATTEAKHLGANIRLLVALLERGKEATALDQIKVIDRIVSAIGPERIGPEGMSEIYFTFALAHLRYGETQNCCLARNKDSCLLPIRGGGLHAKPEGSRAAIAYLAKAVELAAPDSDRALDALWLWNIAAMTLGEHPAGVPAKHRIPPANFLSREKFPRLMNIAVDLDLDAVSMCGSTVAEDFNNDGYLDLLVSTWDVRAPLKLYINTGAGGFVERSSAAGLDGICGGLNMVQGDYNNDGRVDVYILRGAWLGASGRITGSLLRNNGDGTFTDVTFPAGLSEVSYPGQGAAWADYDLDGWLDLFVCGEEGPDNRAPCRLFHNNGDGTFTDVAAQAGVATHQFSKGCTWGDYNNDRYPDLYVSNLGGPLRPGSSTEMQMGNRLYRNNGDGTFTNVAHEAGVAMGDPTFGSWFWDYNNDGVLDLYVARYDSSTKDAARFYLGRSVPTGRPAVFRGTPESKFVEMTAELGLNEPTLPMGSNFGDVDHDGWLDIYLGTGSPDFQMIIPNKLYRNVGGQRFADVSEAAGMAHLQKGHGLAFADLDADGDQDIFIQMGGAFPVDSYADGLFENPGFGNHWIAVELVGVASNRFGVGSRIRVDVEENGQSRSIYKWVNSGGSFGCNSLRQQIGVGQAATIKRLEVYWPKSDTTQTFENVAVDGIVRVTEGEAELARVELRPTKFATAKPNILMGPAPMAPGR